MVKSAALVLALVVCAHAAAEPFDLVISGETVHGLCATGMSYRVPYLEWSDVHYQENTNVHAVASGDGRNVFALLRDYRNLRIVRIDPSGEQLPFFLELGTSGNLMAVAKNGDVFVLTVGGGLLRISPAGEKEAAYGGVNFMPAASGHYGFLSVAPDSCTIYYRKSAAVGRMNGCTGETLPDLAPSTPYGSPTDAQQLSTGDVLVVDPEEVRLFDASGAFIRTFVRRDDYDVPGYFQRIAIAPDEQTFWVTALAGCGYTGYLLRLIPDGTEVERRQSYMVIPFGFAAGVDFASIPRVPAVSGPALIALAITLALAAISILER